MRRYYLHTRHDGIIYAELVDPQTRLKLSARSTETKNRDEALLKVAEWLKTGIPTGREKKPRTLEAAANIETILKVIKRAELNSDDALRIVQSLKDRNLIDIAAVKPGKGTVLFSKFLEEFWDYVSSPYIREKLAHGHSISKRHCYDSMSRLNRYWQPAFKDKRLNSITRQDLKKFSLSLADIGLASATINKIMAVGTTCLSWAFREGLIPVDPTVGLVNFTGEAKKRGVLTPLEAQTLFAKQWKNKRAYTASLLACTTGMRSGEVLALKRKDIGERSLNVLHSWSSYDGLKKPKNGETRRVPLLPEVRGYKILELVEKYGAGTCVYETNQGGDMIKSVLTTAGVKCKLEGIRATADKEKRAMNSSLISVQGRLHIVRGENNIETLEELEAEMTNWQPGEDSPDRMDALVHTINYCEENTDGFILTDEQCRIFHGRR
ncbi:MAG: integrase [Treponema sp.]|nr:integrase [Treponema sp.]